MSNAWRILNRDGTLNIAGRGQQKILFSDLYHSLLSITWPRFFFHIFVAYFLINFVFAAGYFVCPQAELHGIRMDTPAWHFLDCFFFSVQTIATIGYGRISPYGLLPNFLVTLEAFIGLLGLALVTGLFFSRFARPTSRVLFSNFALMSTFDGHPCFLFRMANARQNQIVEAHISAVIGKTVVTAEGETFRKLFDLKLERDHSPIFSLSWTIIHLVNEQSPLYEMDNQAWEKCNAEIFVTLTGTDETFSQTIHDRFSYTPEDLRWNQQFVDVISRKPDGKFQLDLTHFHDTKPAV